MAISARNKLQGRVSVIKAGEAMCLVTIDVQGTKIVEPTVAAPPNERHTFCSSIDPPIPPSLLAFNIYPLPFLPAAKRKLAGNITGPCDPRSASFALSCAQLVGAKASISCSVGESFKTESL